MTTALLQLTNTRADCALCNYRVEGHFDRERFTDQEAKAGLKLLSNPGTRVALREDRSDLKHTDISWESPLLAGLRQKTAELIFKNMRVLQLTEGCSGGCKSCGNGADFGVKDQLSFKDIRNIFRVHGHRFRSNHVFPYYGSDPLDYQDPKTGHTYLNVSHLFKTECGYMPGLRTIVPRGKVQLAKDLADFGIRFGISLSYMNTGRLKHDWPELFDPSTLKQKYPTVDIDRIKFNRSLNQKTSSADADPLENFEGIGCFDGLLLTPAGFYNVIQGVGTPDFPEAQMRIKIDPSQFNLPLPDHKIDAKELLTMGVVSNSALMHNGYQGYNAGLQYFFNFAGESAFRGNIIEISNHTQKRAYRVNFLTGTAEPAADWEYQMTRSYFITAMAYELCKTSDTSRPIFICHGDYENLKLIFAGMESELEQLGHIYNLDAIYKAVPNIIRKFYHLHPSDLTALSDTEFSLKFTTPIINALANIDWSKACTPQELESFIAERFKITPQSFKDMFGPDINVERTILRAVFSGIVTAAEAFSNLPAEQKKCAEYEGLRFLLGSEFPAIVSQHLKKLPISPNEVELVVKLVKQFNLHGLGISFPLDCLYSEFKFYNIIAEAYVTQLGELAKKQLQDARIVELLEQPVEVA
jgi:hypothetical protein